MDSSVAPLGDIAGKRDIRLMVDSFYEGIRSDEQLGPVFDSKIADWSKHLSTMYSFWDSILFGTADYRCNPFAKHMNPLAGHAHFKRWIEIFIATVDRLFEGPKAEQAKAAAKSIAHSFQLRMGVDTIRKLGHSLRAKRSTSKPQTDALNHFIRSSLNASDRFF